MDKQQFTELINGKYFVEINNTSALLQFTNNDQDGQDLRNIATNAGVLVFLRDINKIFVRGVYYGISNEDWTALSTKVDELDQTIQSMGTPLANLAGLVATNKTNLEKLTALVGASELAEGASTILTRISSLETQIGAITGGTSIGEAVNNLVDARLNEVLDSKIETYLTTNEYVTETDLSTYLTDNKYITETDLESYATNEDLGTIRTNITTLQTALDQKAAASDFNNLVALVGAGSLSEANLGGSNKTVITVVNELSNTTQTLTQDLSDLNNLVSGIPKFDIQVKDSIPTITNGELPSGISLTTVYLVVSPADEQDPKQEGSSTSDEMYTEYICIDINAGKTDPETGQPLSPYYKWEKLGRQAFKMSQYMNSEQIQAITDDLDERLQSLVEGLNGTSLSQVNTNKQNIETLQTTVSGLQTSITNIENRLQNIIGANGEFLLTGEDINTTASGTTTIAEDIQLLKDNKVDKTSLNWVIISE